jgi:hypothetical protein
VRFGTWQPVLHLKFSSLYGSFLWRNGNSVYLKNYPRPLRSLHQLGGDNEWLGTSWPFFFTSQVNNLPRRLLLMLDRL